LKANKERIVTLSYEPAFWRPRIINFTIVSGKYLRNIEVKLEEEKSYPLFEVVIILLSISLLINFYLLVKKKLEKSKKELI
jgi:hypothetical protein